VSTALWFAAELLRDRPAEWPLRAAAAAAIAAGAADPGDTVSAQMVRTTPQVSPDERTITVIGTGTSRILSEATMLDAFVRPLARLPRTRVCSLSGLGAHSAGHLARAGQLSRTAINSWTRSVYRGRRSCRER
jgi:hypothetical protein